MRLRHLVPLAVLVAACASLAPQRSDELFARVERGMTPDEVMRLAGKPDNIMAFPLSGDTSWGYLYFDPYGYYVEFSVTFKDGRAASKMSRRLNDGGDLGT